MNRGGYGLNRVRAGRVLIVYTLDPSPKQRGILRAAARGAPVRRPAGRRPMASSRADAGRRRTSEPPAPTPWPTTCWTVRTIRARSTCRATASRSSGCAFATTTTRVRDWRDDWDSTAETATLNRLPAAVEIAPHLGRRARRRPGLHAPSSTSRWRAASRRRVPTAVSAKTARPTIGTEARQRPGTALPRPTRSGNVRGGTASETLRNERGIALFIVLVIVALLTIIVTEFTYSVQLDQHRVRNSIHALQAALLARSGVNLAEGFLSRTRSRPTMPIPSSGGSTSTSSAAASSWSRPCAFAAASRTRAARSTST